jgi:murein DD-endopeptidase MepM/ murein hydrolase activator NlpD
MRGPARVLVILVLAFAGSLVRPGVASATLSNAYSLPFFDPSFRRTQPFGCTGFTSEPAYGSCAHYHIGIDYDDYGSPFTIASAFAGKVVKVVESHVSGECTTQILEGNYAVIQDSTNHYTIYYHLKYNSVIPAEGVMVSAGQKIATAGSTGSACGIHLHYMLSSSSNPDNQSAAINPDCCWTVGAYGKVPWLAHVVAEANGGTEDIPIGTTKTHWVQFQNDGGRTWYQTNDSLGHDKLVLYSTGDSGDQYFNSPLQAADWSTGTLVTFADETSVAPGSVGTLSFGLRAGSSQFAVGQGYTNHFNLQSYGLWWFDYGPGGNDDYLVHVNVVANCHIAC